MFFMNIANCICAAILSGAAQKLCIIKVIGTRNRTINHAPHFALYPKAILRPPKKAIIPDAGTVIEAKGTPAVVA